MLVLSIESVKIGTRPSPSEDYKYMAFKKLEPGRLSSDNGSKAIPK